MDIKVSRRGVKTVKGKMSKAKLRKSLRAVVPVKDRGKNPIRIGNKALTLLQGVIDKGIDSQLACIVANTVGYKTRGKNKGKLRKKTISEKMLKGKNQSELLNTCGLKF